jgi:threonine dehydratase
MRVEQAAQRIRPDIKRTPLEHSPSLSRLAGAEVYLKWECEQRTGSFKFRGALNKVRSLSMEDKKRGVVLASTGNHGLGISLAAEIEGVGLTLVLPQNVSPEKKRRLEKGRAEIIVRGESCDQAEIRARRMAEETGRVFVSPYNDQEIIAGQGTIGLEIDEDLEGLDAVVVPVGGGGLVAGIAGYLKTIRHRIRIFGVEPKHSAFMAASIRAGRVVEIKEKDSIADAVAGGIEPGSITFPLCQELLDGIITVREGMIRQAMSLLYEDHQRMVEGAGALPLAALLTRRGPFIGKRVVLVVSGGNISPETFHSVVSSS